MMTELTIHSADTAPEAAKPLIEKSMKNYGMLPNLHGVMAEAPALLQGYQALSEIYAQTSMSVLERQIVLMAINRVNACHYCMAAHSMLATMEKMPDDILTALRDGTPLADGKLQALRHFAEVMTETRGWPDETDLQALFDAGYSKQTVLEVVLAIGYKVMSNYVNHIAATPLDEPFVKFQWKTHEEAMKVA